MSSKPANALASLPISCLVGVSGGIDSVALLHALVAAGKEPVVLHFDHAWRPESRRDVEFVRELAAHFGLKFHTARASAVLKKSEQTARTARWNFFEKAARKFRCKDLILAHNADDQVETFLLQLLRGGGSGARGMRPVTRREKQSIIVHRPWLGLWRSEIAAYAKCHHLAWHEDGTNRDTRLLRNRVRHRLLPYLKKQFSPDAPSALWRAAEILSAESEWLDELVAKSKPNARDEKLSVRALRTLPVGHVRRILRQWLFHRGISDIGFDDIEAVRSLLSNRVPAKINLSADRHARRRSGFLFIE